MQEAHPSIAPGILSLFEGIVQHNTAAPEVQGPTHAAQQVTEQHGAHSAAVGQDTRQPQSEGSRHQSNASAVRQASGTFAAGSGTDEAHTATRQHAAQTYGRDPSAAPAAPDAQGQMWAHPLGGQPAASHSSQHLAGAAFASEQACTAMHPQIQVQLQRQHEQQLGWQREQQHARLRAQQQAQLHRHLQAEHASFGPQLQQAVQAQPAYPHMHAAQQHGQSGPSVHMLIPKQLMAQPSHTAAGHAAGWPGAAGYRSAPQWPQQGPDTGYGQWRGQR